VFERLNAVYDDVCNLNMNSITQDDVYHIDTDHISTICVNQAVHELSNSIDGNTAMLIIDIIKNTTEIAEQKIDEATQDDDDDDDFDWGSGYMIAIYVLVPIIVILVIVAVVLKQFYYKNNNFVFDAFFHRHTRKFVGRWKFGHSVSGFALVDFY
jgi:hypothetical protein